MFVSKAGHPIQRALPRIDWDCRRTRCWAAPCWTSMRYRKSASNLMRDPDQFFAALLRLGASRKNHGQKSWRRPGASLRVMIAHARTADGCDVEDINRAAAASNRARSPTGNSWISHQNVPRGIFRENADDRQYVLANRAAEKFWARQARGYPGQDAHEGLLESGSRISSRCATKPVAANALIF